MIFNPLDRLYPLLQLQPLSGVRKKQQNMGGVRFSRQAHTYIQVLLIRRYAVEAQRQLAKVLTMELVPDLLVEPLFVFCCKPRLALSLRNMQGTRK